MAELLVRLVDKTSDDPYLDAKLAKRGDVIAVVPDGHEWGGEELRNPDWKIVRVPGVGVEGLGWLMAPEQDADPHQPSRVLQFRAHTFDVDAAPTSYAELCAAATRKPARRDPNVID